jgi:hypothetical protein
MKAEQATEAELEPTEPEALDKTSSVPDKTSSAPDKTSSASETDALLQQWLSLAGAARFRQDLVDNDLWSASLLTKLAETGRLRDALREAGISSVGAREALTLAVEESAT